MSSEFSITRTAVLDAPAPAVFAQLEDFRNWKKWSFWEKTDPAMQRTFTGAERGVGAHYAWSGNAKAGAGSMEIVDAKAGRQVVIELKLRKPFKAVNPTVISLNPVGADRTEVTWQMTGTSGPVMRLLTRVVKMDDVLAQQIDDGLAELGRVAAAGS